MSVVKLPDTLIATVDVVTSGDDPRNWRNQWQYFIVLQFGSVEIARWEWQPDRPLDERESPDDDDIQQVVAEKLRALFTPRED